MDKKMLDRINELAKKKKEQGLTEAEQKIIKLAGANIEKESEQGEN